MSFLYAIIATQVHLRGYVYTRPNFFVFCDARDVVRVILVHAVLSAPHSIHRPFISIRHSDRLVISEVLP